MQTTLSSFPPRFKVGNRVRIRKGSRYHRDCSLCGTIVDYVPDSKNPICVKFDNGFKEWYGEIDLRFPAGHKKGRNKKPKLTEVKLVTKSDFMAPKFIPVDMSDGKRLHLLKEELETFSEAQMETWKIFHDFIKNL